MRYWSHTPKAEIERRKTLGKDFDGRSKNTDEKEKESISNCKASRVTHKRNNNFIVTTAIGAN